MWNKVHESGTRPNRRGDCGLKFVRSWDFCPYSGQVFWQRLILEENDRKPDAGLITKPIVLHVSDPEIRNDCPDFYYACWLPVSRVTEGRRRGIHRHAAQPGRAGNGGTGDHNVGT